MPAILNAMHNKAISERAANRELKGEWLIYKWVENKNYYLCLATHKERDQNIFENKLKPCLMEFPELN